MYRRIIAGLVMSLLVGLAIAACGGSGVNEQAVGTQSGQTLVAFFKSHAKYPSPSILQADFQDWAAGKGGPGIKAVYGVTDIAPTRGADSQGNGCGAGRGHRIREDAVKRRGIITALVVSPRPGPRNRRLRQQQRRHQVDGVQGPESTGAQRRPPGRIPERRAMRPGDLHDVELLRGLPPHPGVTEGGARL